MWLHACSADGAVSFPDHLFEGFLFLVSLLPHIPSESAIWLAVWRLYSFRKGQMVLEYTNLPIDIITDGRSSTVLYPYPSLRVDLKSACSTLLT